MSRTTAIFGGAVIAAAVLVVAGAASLGGRSGRGTAPGSSFRADESGLLGARRILEELGYRVGSRRGAKLPDGAGHVLIRVEGLRRDEDREGFLPGRREIPEEEETAAGASLDRWVQDGNAVLLVGADTPRGASWPPIALRPGARKPDSAPEPTPWKPPEPKKQSAREALARLFGGDRPQVPTDDGADVEEVSTLKGPGDPWISERYEIAAPPGSEVLCTSPDEHGRPTPVVVETKRGRGRVVLVADPFFLSNVRLAGSDNAAWLAVLVARLHGGGDVWFDDRSVGQAASRGVMSLFAEAGLGPALAAGMLLVLLWWWRAGPSDAPERHLREAPAYRPETFALLRADLYADCLSSQDAKRMIEDEVARRLGRGDGGGCGRSLAMLAARDPARAARIRGALAALPDGRRATPRLKPDLWCAAVAGVWRALDDDHVKERR